MADLFLGFCTSDKSNNSGIELKSGLILAFYTQFSEENTALTVETVNLRILGKLCKLEELLFIPEMFGRRTNDSNAIREIRDFMVNSKHGLTYNPERKEISNIIRDRLIYNKGIIVEDGLPLKDMMHIAIADDSGDEAIKVDIKDMFTQFDRVRTSELDSSYSIYRLDSNSYSKLFEQ